jgi:phosphatidylglycerol:prolipoprotein diacylglycerol transferase
VGLHGQGRLLRHHIEAMIPDTHIVPSDWGIRPVLFAIGRVPVTSYAFFVTLGLLVGVVLYVYNTRGKGVGNNGVAVAVSAIVGGIIGAKVPIWIANLPQLIAHPSTTNVLSGRTIVGGLVGGVLAVWLVKRRLGIKRRLGNYLVPSLCLGIAIGRLGCFFTGCCYGKATGTAWGIDFGDHLARHPTQLYESAFALVLFAIAQVTLERWEPGKLFRAFMIAYFSWRFLIEFVRVDPAAGFGLTYYQIASAAIVLAYVGKLYVESRGRTLGERNAAAQREPGMAASTASATSADG